MPKNRSSHFDWKYIGSLYPVGPSTHTLPNSAQNNASEATSGGKRYKDVRGKFNFKCDRVVLGSFEHI